MRFRGISVIVPLALALGAPIAAAGQQPARVAQIGVLSSGFPPSSPQYMRSRFDAFLQGLRERGYDEGQSVTIHWGFASGQDDQLPALAADLVARKVDVIVTTSTPATLVAQRATGVIPIVMTGLADPLRSGLVKSLARPGGNTTGLSQTTAEIYGKRLELLREAVPGLTRVAVLYNPTNRPSVDDWKETDAAARSVRLQVLPVEARDARELEAAVSAMIRERVHGLVVTADQKYVNERVRLASLALQARLPTIFWTREFAQAGGLMTYGPNVAHLYRRAATYVDKILKGAKPSDLPVEQPTIFELLVNLKTARDLGLAIPQSILIRTDELIQ